MMPALFMARKEAIWWVVSLTVVLVVIAGGVVLLSNSLPKPGANVADAAVLALITAGAVGIERIMETFWTVIGSTVGTWWPLKPIGERLKRFVSNLDAELDPFFERAEEVTRRARKAGELTENEIQAASKELKEFKWYADQLKNLAPGNPRALAIANAVAKSTVQLERMHPGLSDAASQANRALASVNNFVLTFDDNPGRRLLSIYFGAMLGLIFAGALGLDVIQATLETKLVGGLGIVATGLLMGLGATPTHEVIKTLQEIKKSRKA